MTRKDYEEIFGDKCKRSLWGRSLYRYIQLLKFINTNLKIYSFLSYMNFTSTKF